MKGWSDIPFSVANLHLSQNSISTFMRFWSRFMWILSQTSVMDFDLSWFSKRFCLLLDKCVVSDHAIMCFYYYYFPTVIGVRFTFHSVRSTDVLVGKKSSYMKLLQTTSVGLCWVTESWIVEIDPIEFFKEKKRNFLLFLVLWEPPAKRGKADFFSADLLSTHTKAF